MPPKAHSAESSARSLPAVADSSVRLRICMHVQGGCAAPCMERSARALTRCAVQEAGGAAGKRGANTQAAAAAPAPLAGLQGSNPGTPHSGWGGGADVAAAPLGDTEYLFARTCCNALLIAYKIAEPAQCQRAVALLSVMTECAPPAVHAAHACSLRRPHVRPCLPHPRLCAAAAGGGGSALQRRAGCC